MTKKTTGSAASSAVPSKKLTVKKDALKDLSARPRKGQAVKGAGRSSNIST